MRKVLIAAFAAVAGMSTAAYAADLGGSMKDAPEAYEAPAIWSGFYVGGSVGFGVGKTTGQLKFDQPEIVLTKTNLSEEDGFDFSKLFSSDYDVSGAIYGVHAGYNFQRGNLVYGIEAGFNGTNMDGSDTCVFVFKCERELDWYATGVGRLGYAVGNTMFYGFGGVAWGKVKTDVSLLGESFIKGDTTHVGWTAGAGIEHAFNDRFTARVEYSHVDLGEEDFSITDYVKDKVDLSFDAIKIGASYKLFDRAHELEPLK